MPRPKAIWTEDDATMHQGPSSGHVSEVEAYKKLFGEKYPPPEQREQIADWGDCFLLRLPRCLMIVAPDGAQFFKLEDEAALLADQTD